MRRFPKTSEDFHLCYSKTRMAIVIAFAVISMLAALVAYGHVFDMEIRTPEWDHLENAVRDKENERCFEKLERDPNSCSEREIERAGTWGQDHSA